MCIRDFGQQCVAIKRAADAFDVAVTRCPKYFDGRRVDAFEQQELDMRFVKRGFGQF